MERTCISPTESQGRLDSLEDSHSGFAEQSLLVTKQRLRPRFSAFGAYELWLDRLGS